jgi:hypothetical protein
MDDVDDWILDSLRSAGEKQQAYSVSSRQKDTRQVKDRESKNQTRMNDVSE